MKSRIVGLLAVLLFATAPAHATLWNWSINNTTGTFTTTGTDSSAGNYSLLDFSVTSSTDGASIGSMLGGQYVASGFATTQPYDFDWNGSAVTSWNSAGGNTFNWWVFDALASNFDVFFGWRNGNVNDPSQGSVYDLGLGCCNQPSYQISMAEARAVPEPASLTLLAFGLMGLGFAARRRRA